MCIRDSICVEDNEWSLAVELIQKDGYSDCQIAWLAGLQKRRYRGYLDDMKKALHFAGYEVSMSDANGAGLPELGDSTSPAVAQTVDGVRYDTRKAESLCSNKVVMFEDFYVELFEDAAGNYFTVLYQLSGCQHHTITPVSARAAKQFLERFGSRA